MRLLPLIAAATLAGCGPGENDPGPGGVTAGEARELNEAAAMLDADSVSQAALANSEDSR